MTLNLSFLEWSSQYYLRNSHFFASLYSDTKESTIWNYFSVIDNHALCLYYALFAPYCLDYRSVNHTGSQNYNFEHSKLKLNETIETQSATSIRKLKKRNTQYTGNQKNIPTITDHVFVEESKKSNSLSMWCPQPTAQYLTNKEA